LLKFMIMTTLFVIELDLQCRCEHSHGDLTFLVY